MNKDNEGRRSIFWCDVWKIVAGSSTCMNKRVATVWADEALEEFDKRFPSEEKEKLDKQD